MMAERDEDKHFPFVQERGLLLKTKKIPSPLTRENAPRDEEE
jgi:hypothetical protein